MSCIQDDVVNSENIFKSTLKNTIHNLLMNSGKNISDVHHDVEISIEDGCRLKSSFFKENKEDLKTNIEKVKIVTVGITPKLSLKGNSSILFENNSIKKEIVFYFDSPIFLEKAQKVINDFFNARFFTIPYDE